MNRFSNRSYTSDQPLTIEQIAQFAPSALAVAPHQSRSARYTYIPTVNIIEGMIKSGFQPFKATQSLVPTATDFGTRKRGPSKNT